MANALTNFRAKYPGYDDIGDTELAGMLAKKYPDAYGDLPAAFAEVQEPTIQKPPDVQQPERIPEVLPTPEIPGTLPALEQPALQPSGPGIGDSIGRKVARSLGKVNPVLAGLLGPETSRNIGQIIPAVETAASLATGAAATPIAGLTGLGALAVIGGDISKAAGAQGAVQEALTFQPRTEGGKDLLATATKPLTLLQKAASTVADPIEELGFPNVAATVASGIEAAPLAIGARLTRPKKPSTELAKIARETKKTVVDSINKAVNPPSAAKKTASATAKYDNQALGAVESITKNKELSFLDESGVAQKRLPKSLGEFQSAISQTLDKVFKKYDKLTKDTESFTQVRPVKYPLLPGEKVLFDSSGKATGIGTKTPFKVKGEKVTQELRNFLNDAESSQAVRVNSPTTIKYAEKKLAAYAAEEFSASSAQRNIQLLNKSLDAFYKDPSPANYGKSLVDSLIVNNMRAELAAIIEKSTGKEYTALKKEYSNIKAMEDSVSKAANADRNKVKGAILPDFTDVIAGHQIVSGLVAANPSVIAGGAFMKSVSAVRKALKDPNKRVERMFETVDKNLKKQAKIKSKIGGE